MYTFVNAVVLGRSAGAQWADADLSDIIVYDIFNSYVKVYLVLDDPNLTEDVFVDFSVLKTEFSSYTGTLDELLTYLDLRVLPTVLEIPSTNVKRVKYSDAIRSQYKVSLTNIGIETPGNYPQLDLHDLEITRPKYNTPLELLHSHCLVSINGYYHMTDTDGERAFIHKGADTMRSGKNNHIGITSFLDVGALTKIKLDKDFIVGQTPTSPLSEKVYFTVPDNLDGKSYILILDGYMVLPDTDVFWRNGEHSFALNLNMLPYLERIYEASLYMDMTELGLSDPIVSPETMILSEVWSDAIIKNYLTMSQSYLVLVDTPNLVSNKIHLRHSNLPGMFTAYQDPTMPLFAGHGKVAEYWKTFEDDHWSVTVQDSFLRNYILSEQPTSNSVVVNNHLLSTEPYKHSRGYLLDIAGY